jgi:hypothetical protein
MTDEVMLKSMGPLPTGGWGMELEGGPIPAIADYMANMLGMMGDEKPSNYVQMEVHHREHGWMILNLQRKSGETPHALRVKAELERDKLKEAMENISNGDVPRNRAKPWAKDGSPSKHDRCEHDRWFYEDCDTCTSNYAQSVLESL